MANYSIDIKHKYGTKSYQETKNTYEWILKAFAKSNIDISHKKEDFSFYMGKLHCSTTSFEEFVENAYGCDGYDLGRFQIYVFEKGEIILSVHCSTDKLSISSESKAMIETVVNSLESTSLDEAEINGPISIEIKAPIVIGDKNVVGNDITGNNNNINSDISATDKKTSKFKAWLESLAQNLLANWLWYLIGVGVSALLAYGILK